MWTFLAILFFVLFVLTAGYALVQRDTRIKKESEVMNLSIKLRDQMRKMTMTRNSPPSPEKNEEDDFDNTNYGPTIYRSIVPAVKQDEPEKEVKPEPDLFSGNEIPQPPKKDSTAAPKPQRPKVADRQYRLGLLFPEENELFSSSSYDPEPQEEVRKRESPKPAKTDHAFLDKVRKIINDNMSDPQFGVEQLSEALGMSRVHLGRKFKEITSITPNALIKDIRINEATRLLVQKDTSIYEIARKCGFASASYFSTSFKSVYGITPKEFSETYPGVSLEEALSKKNQ